MTSRLAWPRCADAPDPAKAPHNDLDGSAEIKLAQNLIGRGFALTDKQIYYLHQEHEGLTALRSLLVIGGKSSVIASFAKTLDLGLSISPDLKYALYTQVDQEGSTLMLVDEFP